MNMLKTVSYHGLIAVQSGWAEEIKVTKSTNVNGVTTTTSEHVQFHQTWDRGRESIRIANGIDMIDLGSENV
jgi:hypothetical protein